MSTFISVGNAKQEFRRFFTLISSASDLFPRPVFVQRGHTQYKNDKFEVFSFTDLDDFQSKMADASVVILHAGAGSVINAINTGKKPIIIPRLTEFGEHIDDHQLEFCKQLAKKNKVYVIQNDLDMRASIHTVLKKDVTPDSVGDPKALRMMRDLLEKYHNRLAEIKINTQ